MADPNKPEYEPDWNQFVQIANESGMDMAQMLRMSAMVSDHFLKQEIQQKTTIINRLVETIGLLKHGMGSINAVVDHMADSIRELSIAVEEGNRPDPVILHMMQKNTQQMKETSARLLRLCHELTDPIEDIWNKPDEDAPKWDPNQQDGGAPIR